MGVNSPMLALKKMINVEIVEEIKKAGSVPLSCCGIPIEGQSRQPLLDACREIKRILGPMEQRAGLFREGCQPTPDEDGLRRRQRLHRGMGINAAAARRNWTLVSLSARTRPERLISESNRRQQTAFARSSAKRSTNRG